MERDYFYPPLADRDDPNVWGASGAPTAWERARDKAKSVLDSHQPAYLSAEQDAEIRARFNIIL
jgi:trimethylamine--corrinoid protein Co-methyltransferase